MEDSLFFLFGILQSKQHGDISQAPFVQAAQTMSLKSGDDSSLSSGVFNGIHRHDGVQEQQEVMLLPLDVIIGPRGQCHSSFLGNIRFNKIIELFIPHYNAATTKRQKSRVVQDIYMAVKESARFVRMVKKNYVEVDEPTGKEKIGQAMRYKQRKAGKRTNALPVSSMVGGATDNSFLLGAAAAETKRIRNLQDRITASLASKQAVASGCSNLPMTVATGNLQVCQTSGQEQRPTDNNCQELTAASSLMQQHFLPQHNVASATLESNATPLSFETTWQGNVDPAGPMEATAPFSGFVPTPFFAQKSPSEVRTHNVSLDDDEEGEIISDDDLFSVLGFPHEYETTN